jgi:hypothetical protein
MKKYLVLGIAITFAGSLLVAPAFGAAKAGATCTKAGATSIVSGKKFTCIKSGKKLVWDSGVAPETNKSNTLNSSQSKSSDDQVVITGTRFVYKFENGKMLRRAANGQFYSTDSRSPEQVDPITLKAFNDVHSTVGNSHPNINFNFVENPNYPQDLVKIIKSELDKSATFWNSRIPYPMTVNVVMATELDLAKLNGEWSKLISPTEIGNAIYHVTDYSVPAKFYQSTGAGGGFVSPFWDTNGELVHTIVFHTASYAKVDTFWPTLVSHEFTHIIQQSFIVSSKAVQGNGWSIEAPTTFTEGSAHTFGNLIDQPYAGWAQDEFITNAQMIANYNMTHKLKTAQDIIDQIVNSDYPKNSEDFEAAYHIGAYLYLWMISQYGLDSYTKLLSNMASTHNFDSAIQQTLGMSKIDFYTKAAPYILSMWNHA